MLRQSSRHDVKSAIMIERGMKKCYSRAPWMMLEVQFGLRGGGETVLRQSSIHDVESAILVERHLKKCYSRAPWMMLKVQC